MEEKKQPGGGERSQSRSGDSRKSDGDSRESSGGGGGRGRYSRSGGGRPMSRGGAFPRRKVCSFCADKHLTINYKNTSNLRRFVTDRGKMIPRRITGVCARHQRSLALSIKQARNIALMPFTVTGR